MLMRLDRFLDKNFSWPLAESNVNNLRHFTLYNALINKSEHMQMLMRLDRFVDENLSLIICLNLRIRF